MNQLYERIVLFSKSNQISLYTIEKGTGMARGSLRKWATSMPSGDRILRVANFLDVSVDYLLGNTNNPQSHKNPENLRDALMQVTEIYKQANATADKILASQNLIFLPNNTDPDEP